MRSAACWAVLGVLVAGTVGIGAKDDPAPPKADAPAGGAATKDVSALIKDLGDPDYRVREDAGKALSAMGDKILPDLRRALEMTDSPEVSRRLTVLIRKLDYDRLVSPRRITLSVKDRPIKEVIDAIAKQSGYKIEFGGGGAEQKVSFEFDNTPFWPAIDAVANAAGLNVFPDYDDEVVRVYNQDAFNPYVSYAGPFRFLATNINSNRSLQLSGLNRRGFNNRQQEYINLSFQIQSEPKNPILGVQQVELTAAEDDTGASLIPPKNQNNNVRSSGYYNQGYRGHNAYASVNLARGGRDAATAKFLKGRVGVVLLAGVTPDVVIPDPVKVKNKKFTGRTVSIDVESITENGNNYSVSLTVTRVGADGQMDYSWANNLWQKLELVDEKGGKYRTYGYNSLSSSPGSVQMTVPFGPDTRMANPPKLGPPVKLIFNEWQAVTHEVTFEFKDVPLP